MRLYVNYNDALGQANRGVIWDLTSYLLVVDYATLKATSKANATPRSCGYHGL